MTADRNENVRAGAEPPGVMPALPASACPFGPLFFLRHLAAFVRDRCPDPAEGLPLVEIHLADGEVLDLCHVIGLAPGWAALAVLESDRPAAAPRMRTELVPYEVILRVTVRGSRTEAPHIGFDPVHLPRVLTGPGEALSPEAALAAAAVKCTPQVPRRKQS